MHLLHLLHLLLAFTLGGTVAQSDDVSNFLSNALRSQRELGSAIPVHRIMYPAIASTTYFSNNYTESMIPGTRSLLASLFRRVWVDVYWDARSQRLQLCPFVIPLSLTSTASTSSNTANDTSAFNTTLVQTPLPPTLTVGGITCSTTGLPPSLVLSQFRAWIDSTVSPVTSDLVFLVFNIKDLAVASSTSGNATSSALLSSMLRDAFGNYLYPASQLAQDRADIQGSWRTPSPYYKSQFYPTNGSLFTADGWPTPSYLLGKGYRVLAGLGTLTGALAGYDLEMDRSVLFSSAQINGIPPLNTSNVNDLQVCDQPTSDVTLAETGINAPTSLSPNAPTWAFAYISDSTSRPFEAPFMSRLVSCGYSPQLTQNATLALANATVWSWQYLEPKNSTTQNCAVMNLATGKWYRSLSSTNESMELNMFKRFAEDCNPLLPIACQNTSNPLKWVIPANVILDYWSGDSGCPDGTAFSTPRTPQESAALWKVFKDAKTDDTRLRLNYNDEGVPSCWVVGPYTACPYSSLGPAPIPQIIAGSLREGIIILCVAGIFMILKIRRQIRISQMNRRKAEVQRKIRQMDFECVPA